MPFVVPLLQPFLRFCGGTAAGVPSSFGEPKNQLAQSKKNGGKESNAVGLWATIAQLRVAQIRSSDRNRHLTRMRSVFLFSNHCILKGQVMGDGDGATPAPSKLVQIDDVVNILGASAAQEDLYALMRRT